MDRPGRFETPLGGLGIGASLDIQRELGANATFWRASSAPGVRIQVCGEVELTAEPSSLDARRTQWGGRKKAVERAS
jgi:hypothetical protein